MGKSDCRRCMEAPARVMTIDCDPTIPIMTVMIARMFALLIGKMIMMMHIQYLKICWALPFRVAPPLPSFFTSRSESEEASRLSQVSHERMIYSGSVEGWCATDEEGTSLQ